MATLKIHQTICVITYKIISTLLECCSNALQLVYIHVFIYMSSSQTEQHARLQSETIHV